MVITFSHNKKNYQADLAIPIDISIPLQSGNANPNTFFLNEPIFEPVRANNFIGSVALGGNCNCENLSINAHGNGTHTECVGHISNEKITINKSLKTFFSIAQLISIKPKSQSNGDKVVMLDDVKNILDNSAESIVLRTLPNDESKCIQNYSGANPTYVQEEFCEFLAQKNIKHFLLDLPSVDKESDEGKLLAHHAFWQYPLKPRLDATISEMIYVPTKIEDGMYLLNIQIASFESDASPSKPLLYKLF